MKKIAQNLWENGAKYASKLCAHFMVVAYIFSLDFVYKKINNKIKINNEAEVVCVAQNSNVVKWIFLASATALVSDEITAVLRPRLSVAMASLIHTAITVCM